MNAGHRSDLYLLPELEPGRWRSRVSALSVQAECLLSTQRSYCWAVEADGRGPSGYPFPVTLGAVDHEVNHSLDFHGGI